MIYVQSGGSIDEVPFGIIGVTYPLDATITCKNGDLEARFKKNDEVQEGYFMIPSAGDWTITLNGEGHLTKTTTISITIKGQVEFVPLSFNLTLINGSTVYDAFGIDEFENSKYRVTRLDDGYKLDSVSQWTDQYGGWYNYYNASVRSKNLDLSQYTGLKLTLKDSQNGNMRVYINSPKDNNTLAVKENNVNGVNNFSFTGISSGNIFLHLTAPQGGSARTTITRLELTS